MITKNNPLYNLPVDQYSRQKWASNIINQLETKNTKLAILDVGGYKGKTSVFHPNDDVTICDLFDVAEENYVKGDGRSLPFETKQFDYVVTFDTYEHVPRKDREKFINELSRVAKKGFILAAPFDDLTGTVAKAEIDLNIYHQDLHKKDHRWLKEHIDFKIPLPSEIEKLFKKAGLFQSSMQSNDINVWMVIQSIYFSIELDEDLRGRMDDVNRYYNQNLEAIDVPNPCDVSYRKIYFVSSNKSSNEVITKYFESIINKTDQLKKESFFALALSVFGKKYRDVEIYKMYLESELQIMKAQNAELDNKVKELEHYSLRENTKRVIRKLKSK